MVLGHCFEGEVGHSQNMMTILHQAWHRSRMEERKMVVKKLKVGWYLLVVKQLMLWIHKILEEVIEMIQNCKSMEMRKIQWMLLC